MVGKSMTIVAIIVLFSLSNSVIAVVFSILLLSFYVHACLDV